MLKANTLEGKMFTIKVVYRSTGDPVENMKVCVSFSGMRGMTDEVWTDRNGEANFDYTPGNGKVFLDGRTSYEGEISGRVVIYV